MLKTIGVARDLQRAEDVLQEFGTLGERMNLV